MYIVLDAVESLDTAGYGPKRLQAALASNGGLDTFAADFNDLIDNIGGNFMCLLGHEDLYGNSGTCGTMVNKPLYKVIED